MAIKGFITGICSPTLEVEKSRDLLPASWTPWHTGGGIQSQGSENQKHQHPRAGNAKSSFTFLCLFFSLGAVGGFDEASYPGEGGSLLGLPIHMLIPCRDILTGTSRKDALPAPWESLCPVKLTHRINHHFAPVQGIPALSSPNPALPASSLLAPHLH